jgi:hypothetical protein
MMTLARLARVVCFLCCLSVWMVRGAEPAPRLTEGEAVLAGLADFRPVASNWTEARVLAGDPRRDAVLQPIVGAGMLVNRPTKTQRGHLFSAWEHGDVDLELEFLLAPGSNSGVYLMGRYEVQLRDSWRVAVPGVGESGAVYSRWDGARGVGNESFEGAAPRVNAARAPGLWQTLRVEFRAPRFAPDGTKQEPARFVRVWLNGTLVQENVTIGGPTRSAAFADEAPWGPLMIQGDHGSLAIRGLRARFPVPPPPPDPTVRVRRVPAPIVVTVPADRTILQRAFIAFPPVKRLYAAAVGTPAALHYAYDFERGALLRVWRGGFIDTAEMWYERGDSQLAKPLGAPLDLTGKAGVALLETPAVDGWPESPGDLYASQGYRLESDGTPVFLATLSSLQLSERFAPAAEGVGLTRTVTVEGTAASWAAFVLLAEADQITPALGGWVIGDRAYYLDWPETSPHRPVVVTAYGRQRLVVPVGGKNPTAPVSYTLVW